MLKRTPFYDFHVQAAAKMVDFAGWEMPILYHSIVEEHEQTRNSGSLFDVSHMGRLTFTGSDVPHFLNYVLTRNVADQAVGQSRYSLVCNEGGGVIDDIIVSRDAKNWTLVCNGSNREKVIQHFTTVRRDKGFDFDMADNTEATAMVAIQGPKVLDKLSEVIPGVDLRAIKRYHFQPVSIMGLLKLTIYRSGYTGEDGVEIVLSAKMASMAIKMLGARADKPDATIKPAGLGARDTLRLEAGMPLYGHELNDQTDPITSGLGWAVDTTKDFLGLEPIRRIKETGPRRKLVGIELEGKRIARQGTPITRDGRPIGEVTSGTFSPTLQKSIAMAFVETAHAGEGTDLTVELKGAPTPAKTVKLPFYKKK